MSICSHTSRRDGSAGPPTGSDRPSVAPGFPRAPGSQVKGVTLCPQRKTTPRLRASDPARISPPRHPRWQRHNDLSHTEEALSRRPYFRMHLRRYYPRVPQSVPELFFPLDPGHRPARPHSETCTLPTRLRASVNNVSASVGTRSRVDHRPPKRKGPYPACRHGQTRRDADLPMPANDSRFRAHAASSSWATAMSRSMEEQEGCGRKDMCPRVMPEERARRKQSCSSYGGLPCIGVRIFAVGDERRGVSRHAFAYIGVKVQHGKKRQVTRPGTERILSSKTPSTSG